MLIFKICSIIFNENLYFQVLNSTVDNYKNSFEFCQAESAALLVKLLKYWNSKEDKLKNWISEARDQLSCIKNDIYQAVCNRKPFYGILIILLNSYVKDFKVENLEHECILSDLLELLEDAVQFFTDTLLKPIKSSGKLYFVIILVLLVLI